MDALLIDITVEEQQHVDTFCRSVEFVFYSYSDYKCGVPIHER